MTKLFCDHCGKEIEKTKVCRFSLVDTYSVIGIDWDEKRKTYCDFCSDCREQLKALLESEISGFLRERCGACDD